MAKHQTEDVRALMLETARVQLAAMNASIAFWRGWLDGATTFSQSATKELLSLTKKDVDANEIVGRLTDSSRAYLRSMTELPGLAAAQFNSDLADLKAEGENGSGKHARAARAKE